MNRGNGIMLTQAGKYATAFGYKTLAEQGRGEEFNKSLLSSAFRRISMNGMNQINQGQMRSFNSGMQFTGVAQSKIRSNAVSGMAAQSMQAINQVHEDDMKFRLDAASKWIDVLKHEDNVSLQREQIKAQEGDLLDTMAKVAAIIGAIG